MYAWVLIQCTVLANLVVEKGRFEYIYLGSCEWHFQMALSLSWLSARTSTPHIGWFAKSQVRTFWIAKRSVWKTMQLLFRDVDQDFGIKENRKGCSNAIVQFGTVFKYVDLIVQDYLVFISTRLSTLSRLGGGERPVILGWIDNFPKMGHFILIIKRYDWWPEFFNLM